MRWLPLLPVICSCTGPSTVQAPLILMVSFDTTRADALSCYGAPDARTPVVDTLALQGVRFARAMSSSSTTLAAHTAVMSGEDSHGHRVPRNGFPVPSELPLLAERLASHGWYTAAAVGSYALESDMGLDRGFARYEDHAGWRAAAFGLYEVNARDVTRSAISLVDARKGSEPVFLFVHYYDPHMPWTSAPSHVQADFIDPEYAGEADGNRSGIGFLTEQTLKGTLRPVDRAHGRALYLAEVAWADRQLGQLLQALESRNLLHDSLITVFSDHGEMFDEEPARPYRHGPDVDLPIVHVPLIIRGQGSFSTPGNRVVDTTVRTLDLGTTLLAAMGDVRPLGTGQDLAQLWSSTPPTTWPLAHAEATRPLEHLRTDVWPNADLERAVISQDTLVTRAPWLDATDHAFRLDAQQSPLEHAPSSLSAALDDFDARRPGPRSADIRPETSEALRALGYLDD